MNYTAISDSGIDAQYWRLIELTHSLIENDVNFRETIAEFAYEPDRQIEKRFVVVFLHDTRDDGMTLYREWAVDSKTAVAAATAKFVKRGAAWLSVAVAKVEVEYRQNIGSGKPEPLRWRLAWIFPGEYENTREITKGESARQVLTKPQRSGWNNKQDNNLHYDFDDPQGQVLKDIVLNALKTDSQSQQLLTEFALQPNRSNQCRFLIIFLDGLDCAKVHLYPVWASDESTAIREATHLHGRPFAFVLVAVLEEVLRGLPTR
jgi:hypothetical protein